MILLEPALFALAWDNERGKCVARKPCPKCGKPMVLVLHPCGKQSGDEIDPLTSPDVRSWIESAALRTPAETKKPE